MKKLFLFLFLLIIYTGSALSGEKPRMLFFFSPGCDECKNIKEEYLPEFLSKYGQYIDFVMLDVSEKANKDSLDRMESRVNFPEPEKAYPAIYFMGNMVEGENQVIMKLAPIVDACLANPDSFQILDKNVMSRIPNTVVSSDTRDGKKVYIAYFYKEGCKKCARANEIIDWLKKDGGNIEIQTFNMSEPDNKILSIALGSRTGVPENKLMTAPVFFFGDDAYVLSDQISKPFLLELVKQYSETGTGPVWKDMDREELEKASEKIKNIFSSFTVAAVLIAGLGDGINPCAFATIIFFITYLGFIGRKRNEIALVGFAFAGSVFLTYFLLGLGFFSIVSRITNIAFLSKIIFGGAGILCIIFGFMSLYDYFLVSKGKIKDMTLQLPSVLKKRIHSAIRENLKTRSMVWGAIVTGFLVSVLELACTGQVYLPTITLMVKEGGFGIKSFEYLLLYNAAFILPLLLVFGIVYSGVSSSKIANIMESNVGMLKLVLAFIFFLLGGLLFWVAL